MLLLPQSLFLQSEQIQLKPRKNIYSCTPFEEEDTHQPKNTNRGLTFVTYVTVAMAMGTQTS